MRISLNHETALPDEFSPIRRPMLVARASFLILVAMGLLLIPSQFAMASCGDYLHQRFATPFNIAKTDTSNSQLPKKCADCQSRSDTPAPLPLSTSERMENAPANLTERHSNRLILSEFFVDSHFLAVAQYFREVSTPPPKPSL
jgi:hypothetical protein